jgi:MFS family permease
LTSNVPYRRSRPPSCPCNRSLLHPAIPPPPENKPHIRGGLIDFRAIFRNKKTIGFSILYGLHNLELAAFSTWLVPLFAFSQHERLTNGDLSLEQFGILAAIISMAALPSSIGFNEVAHKTGRQKLIALVAVSSALISIAFVFTAGLALWVGVVFAILFSMSIAADSAAISGGVISVSNPVHKGRTMSIYSLIGFAGASIGPMVFGMVLDLSGGETIFNAWLITYASIAFLALLAPLIVWRFIGYTAPIK